MSFSQRKSSLRYEKWITRAGGRIRGIKKLSLLAKDLDISSSEEDQQTDDNDKEEVVNLGLLKLSNKDQMSKLYLLLKKLPEAIHFFLNEFIFPQYTRHQVIKLSESGQALGSNFLFPKVSNQFAIPD
jgi:hypothetical protein